MEAQNQEVFKWKINTIVHSRLPLNKSIRKMHETINHSIVYNKKEKSEKHL